MTADILCSSDFVAIPQHRCAVSNSHLLVPVKDKQKKNVPTSPTKQACPLVQSDWERKKNSHKSLCQLVDDGINLSICINTHSTFAASLFLSIV